MENINFKGYKELFYFPNVDFNAELGVCEFSGESFLEDSVKFYAPYIAWLSDYLENNDKLILNFKLSYFNTSSSKRILDILRLLKEYKSKGKSISINWFVPSNDEDIINEVEDFSIITQLEINILEEELA